MFQSSPGTLAGRYRTSAGQRANGMSFNPRPALWPGATLPRPRGRAGSDVSILARHSGRALPCGMPRARIPAEVSILARHSGRALR